MSDYRRVYTSKVADRSFLVVEWETDSGTDGGCSIPVDSIVEIKLSAANGGCENTVKIVTNDGEEHFFAYEGADMIRQYIRDHEIVPNWTCDSDSDTIH